MPVKFSVAFFFVLLWVFLLVFLVFNSIFITKGCKEIERELERQGCFNEGADIIVGLIKCGDKMVISKQMK